jgi:DNA (cytosine-5)-methyltransferase 1
MDYISISEAATKWSLTHRRIQKLCADGRIHGATKIGNSWVIPANSRKPLDARTIRYRKTESLPSEVFTSIDLFAGPGGLCTGFKWAGIKPLIAVEWSYWTVQTYATSHNADIFDLEQYLSGKMPNPKDYFKPSDKTLLIYGDINKVKKQLLHKILNDRFGVSSVDIVTGGAPCESFSLAGDRKENDERNELYHNILRIARAVDSKMFMFENVKGLFSKKLGGKHGGMYRAICDDFQHRRRNSPSYKLVSTDPNTVLLKSADYGVPQTRERLFLVGINIRYANSTFRYPEKTHGNGLPYNFVTVEDAIMDLPQIQSGIESNTYDFDIASISDETRSEYLRRMRGDLTMAPEHVHFSDHSLFNHKAPGHTSKMMARIKSIKPGEGMKSAYDRLLNEGKHDFVSANFPQKIYAARNRRLLLGKPSFTATSHCLDEMVHPTLDRGLTPREVARIQSFPDWYQFQGPYVKFHSDPEQDQYEQIGDAIPPLLGYALGVEIRNTLSEMG